MTSQLRHLPPYRGLSMSGVSAHGQVPSVKVSPSRMTIRRSEPSVSFQVVAAGAQSFDVIIATDPALFNPENAHQRTAKNFRSSRQDFQGNPIEIETGFYLLPRSFIRDMITVEPRPARLFYIAVAYKDMAGADPCYSVPPDQMAVAAPHVTISEDLLAANLSKVLGMAVGRLGAVHSSGSVMAAQPAPSALPDAIGGLPISRRPSRHVQAAPPAHTQPVTPQPAPRPAPIAEQPYIDPNDTPPNNAASPVAIPPKPNNVAAASPNVAPPSGEPFIDEDYSYGGNTLPVESNFRDLDLASSQGTVSDYDDGFSQAAPEPTRKQPSEGENIPPLDPAPQAGAAPAVPTQPQPKPQPTVSGASNEDALLQAVIAEGSGGRYEALNLDGGFRGRLGPENAYYQRAHDGLRLGPHQASQDSGELGELLLLMQAADAAGFAQIFGSDAEEMLSVVTAEGPSGLELEGGRGPRVQPVGGRDLWEDPWTERFRTAARHEPFQAAMRGQILARRLDPLRGVAEALGINSQRGLAMVLSLSILHGVENAKTHLRNTVNPFDAPAKLGAALDALGYSDLGAFRASAGLAPGDTVDADTHFALIAALRALGPDSPVQIPDGEGVMDAMVTTAGAGTLGDALLRLRVSETFQPTQTEV